MRLRRLPAAFVIALGSLAPLLPAGPVAALEAELSVTDQVVQDRLTRRSTAPALGPDLAGVVVDAETGQEIWRRTAGERQIPASTVKLLTAATALESFGPEHTFTTRVMTGTRPRRVSLVGGGDPTLSKAALRRLARGTVSWAQTAGLRRVTVEVDDSLFPAPTLPRGWRSAYLVRDVSPVRALVVGEYRGWDTSVRAGRVFARMLERHGLLVRAVRRAVRPADSTEIVTVTGAPLSTMVTDMLKESDNDVAELLHRLVALQNGYEASWAGAAQAQVDVLARLGVTLPAGKVHDGSGLSRANRLTPRKVAAVLRLAFDPARPRLAQLQGGSLPLAGVNGTLGANYLRYVTWPTRCAQGLVEGKTGSLSGVIALSGIARGADGRVKLYSFLLNDVPSTLTTRRAVDRLATTVTGCW